MQSNQKLTECPRQHTPVLFLQHCHHVAGKQRGEQSNQKTQDGHQWIVAQGLLSALTIPGFIQVVCKRFITSSVRNYEAPPHIQQQRWLSAIMLLICCHVALEAVCNTAQPAWIPIQRRSVVIQQMVASQHQLFS